MKFNTTYESRQVDVTDEIAKEWGIHGGRNAFFLCRITRVEGSLPELWVDLTRVAVFNTNTEGDVFRTYLENLQEGEN